LCHCSLLTSRTVYNPAELLKLAEENPQKRGKGCKVQHYRIPHGKGRLKNIAHLVLIEDYRQFMEPISEPIYNKTSQVEQDMFNEKKMDEWVVREKEIMKDVEGWEIAKKNYSVRWTEPTPGC
jgi:hypothetical protein